MEGITLGIALTLGTAEGNALALGMDEGIALGIDVYTTLGIVDSTVVGNGDGIIIGVDKGIRTARRTEDAKMPIQRQEIT